jgi:hypothetical protein
MIIPLYTPINTLLRVSWKVLLMILSQTFIEKRQKIEELHEIYLFSHL